jgi:SPP1 family predicted phage head-tail adaptor
MFQDGVTVTIVRRTVSGTDSFGNDTYTSVNEDVQYCSIQPAASRENLDFSDQLTSDVVVFVPYGTDVEYIDAIIVDGVQYEVRAQPDVWRSPFSGSTAPVRIEGILVVGAA